MSVYNGPQTVTSGLIAAIDASNIKSMIGTGPERIQSTYSSFGSWNGLVGTSGSYVSKTGKTGLTLTDAEIQTIFYAERARFGI